MKTNEFFILSIFFGLILFDHNLYKHILLCLLSLEFVVISLLLIIYLICLGFNFSFYLYLIMMTFFVCEGALGLSILVYMIRLHGNDYLSGMFMW